MRFLSRIRSWSKWIVKPRRLEDEMEAVCMSKFDHTIPKWRLMINQYYGRP